MKFVFAAATFINRLIFQVAQTDELLNIRHPNRWLASNIGVVCWSRCQHGCLDPSVISFNERSALLRGPAPVVGQRVQQQPPQGSRSSEEARSLIQSGEDSNSVQLLGKYRFNVGQENTECGFSTRSRTSCRMGEDGTN